MRLIDADQLRPDSEWDESYREFVSYSQFQIDAAPTVEAEPVRHGTWIKDKDGFHRCSECGENTDRQEDSFGYDVGEFKNPYCGNCGAKMDIAIRGGR